jgi:hypothetical protein
MINSSKFIVSLILEICSSDQQNLSIEGLKMNSMHQAFTTDATALGIVWQLQKPNKTKLLVDLPHYL